LVVLFRAQTQTSGKITSGGLKITPGLFWVQTLFNFDCNPGGLNLETPGQCFSDFCAFELFCSTHFHFYKSLPKTANKGLA